MYGHIRGLLPLATKYHHLPLKHALNDVAKQYCKQHEPDLCSDEERFRWRTPGYETEGYGDDSENSVSSEDPDHLCQTVCLTAVNTGQIDEAYLLRTYTHRYDPEICPPWVTTYNEDTLDLYTWQVGRATTATPLLFELLVVTGPQGNLAMKDGGIRENNPSYCAFSEAASFWGDDTNPSILLSIGAGYTKSTSDDFSDSGMMPSGLSSLNKYADRLAVFKNILVKYSGGQDRHKMMRTIARGGTSWYKRFEVTDGLEKMRADQWERGKSSSAGKIKAVPGGKTLNTIRTATEAYLNRQEPDKSVNEYAAPRKMLKHTAEKLVRMRRARELEAMTQGGEKREYWEAFMGKHLIGERDFFRKYQEEWDYALLGRKN
ncbi:hypothetical protein J4E93_010097 [Alternaria ventricosa]|uniref:uncharacterized protein n=1 Tax=Alternaria ventricosa TaxID=1187951 RepID=UPI0020C44455|nr:uncharacterized protein J4E93_010097 [Alternaria ventricosa]KAI4638542.1 hypothetical protein J4E93_010097 [Alternaria ventricosa]